MQQIDSSTQWTGVTSQLYIFDGERVQFIGTSHYLDLCHESQDKHLMFFNTSIQQARTEFLVSSNKMMIKVCKF